MENLTYLFAAYTIIWLAALLYTFSIGSRQKALEQEIETLKAVLAEKETGNPVG